MPNVYGFTAGQVERIVAAVEAVEGDAPIESQQAPEVRRRPEPLHHVKVTSTTLSSGFYPGTIQLYDSSTQTWSDGTAVNFLSSNGDAPVLNRRYLARAVGIYASDGKPIYARDVSAAGGGGLAVNTVNPGTGDTTVSNAAVTTIQIDQVSGLKELSGGSTVTIQAQTATATHAGVVTTANQTWVGIKAMGTSSVAGGFSFPASSVASTSYDSVPSSWRIHATGTDLLPSGGGLAFTCAAGVNRAFVVLTNTLADGTTTVVVNKGGFAVYDGTTINYGQTSTLSDGTSVKGGIITTVGTLFSNAMRQRVGSAPTSSTSAGATGEVWLDASWFYVCTSTDTWRRVALSTF